MKILFLISAILIAKLSFSQAPEIEWQNTIGSNGSDVLQSIHQTTDGGYILGGYSNGSMFGDKTEINLGFNDYWIVKLNSFGVIEWQNTIGGNVEDILTELRITSDGGYILGGYSNSSISGDKTEANIAGTKDYWVVKLNSVGVIEWQNTIGGAGEDELYSIDQTLDGGYILGGRSNSPISGDKTEPSDEYYDYWVVKLNSIGDVEWDNTIIGSEYDYVYSVFATSDGGSLIGGMSTSPLSGDKTESCIGGSNDYWIVKLDNSGNIEWQNTIGGNGADFLYCIAPTTIGGYILGGISSSNISEDKTEDDWDTIPAYTYDYWIVNTDNEGTVYSDNTIGGDNHDYLKSIQITGDTGYILGGYSFSGISGDKTDPNVGFEDYWILKLDTLGNIEWQKTIGGWTSDFLESSEATSDGGYILGGYSESPISGDKSEESLGSTDYWVIKLFGNCIPETFYFDGDNDGFGNNYDSISACIAPIGYVSNNTDCNDTNNLINPFATELCNFIDDNCDGSIDEGLPIQTFYIDADGDNYGNALIDSITCLFEIPGFVPDSTDCDDTNPLIYPGAPEILDGIDNNCNKVIDEGFNSIENLNNSGISIYPNPAKDKIILSINNQFKINSSSSISIYDLSGKNILQLEIKSGETEIDVTQFVAGIYFVKVMVEGNQFVRKLIIE